nr:hypothetical protein [Tanacetum cinerariifolium]
MHEVPPPITRTFMPTSYKSDLEETQATFGLKSNTSSINTSESNEFVSCDNSDKSSASETYDFASCVLSPKTNDSLFTVDVKILPKSDVKDPSSTNGIPSCSFKENVKPPRNLCNKSGKADRIYCKNNFVRIKKCFACGSISHLIKDYDVYDTVDNFPFVILKTSFVPVGSRNYLASTFAGRPILTASRNRPASIHASRHIPVGRCNKPAPFPIGRSVPTCWTNHAARPFFRPTNLYFNNVHPYVNKDIAIVDSGCSRSMTGNKEKLDDFVQIKRVLTKEYQLPNESQVVLRIPRRHDLYTFNLSDMQPEQQINYLLAKASLKESTKWHKRMARVNFKTINKLAKHGLVEGLPLKLFTNEHNCVACNKGNQHKASYNAIFARRTIFELFKLLHMDLFGPTSIRSIDHKYYSFVVTDDFSRFSWAFFLGTKDETFYILKNFIALIENQLNKKVKAIRCDNGTEFRNAKLIDLCGVSITNPHNKTPYELLSEKVPNIWHLKPFGCQVTILNTSDHLGKFDGKANDGILLGMLLIGLGQEWYFDLDYLTDYLGYIRFKPNTPEGILVPSFPSNSFSGSKVNDVSVPIENNLDYAEVLARLQRQEHKAHSAAVKYGFEFSNEIAEMLHQAEIDTRRHLVLSSGDPAGSIVFTGGVFANSVPAGSVPASHVPASSVPASHVPASNVPAGGVLAGSINFTSFGDPATSESVPAVLHPDHVANSTLPPASNVVVDPVATKRVNTIHPQSQIIGELQSPVLTRKPSSVATALEDSDWVAAMQEEMQQFYNQQLWKPVPLLDVKVAIGTK